MKKKSAQQKKFATMKAKRSALGRTLCRLFGDDAGGVMMEYVVLGVLVVAAVTLAVIFFGDDIRSAFATMGYAIGGQPKTAADNQKALQSSLPLKEKAATKNAETIAPEGGQF